MRTINSTFEERRFKIYIASGRIAEVHSRSMSCNCMTRTSQQECRDILEKKDIFRKTWGKEEKENNEIGLHKKFY